MGVAGRKALPDFMKVVRGTNQKCRERKEKSKQSPGSLSYPSWLPEDCRPYFDDIKKELSLIGLDSSTYCNVVSMASMRINEIASCNDDVKKSGMVIENLETGVIRANPAVTQRSDALRHLQSLCSELGLTATAIGRVGKIREEEDNKGFSAL